MDDICVEEENIVRNMIGIGLVSDYKNIFDDNMNCVYHFNREIIRISIRIGIQIYCDDARALTYIHQIRIYS